MIACANDTRLHKSFIAKSPSPTPLQTYTGYDLYVGAHSISFPGAFRKEEDG